MNDEWGAKVFPGWIFEGVRCVCFTRKAIKMILRIIFIAFRIKKSLVLLKLKT